LTSPTQGCGLAVFPMADKAFGSVAGLTGNSGNEEGKLVHERVASILPFSVTEKIADKPLRIRGLAMTAGLSRNFNLYTSEELAAFAGKLQAAPVYLEHVSVNDAVGKVTKTEWDGQNLLYEAEIYDEDTAAKIRKGLIRHVSVGADYETLDVTAGGKVPHGLHNAEMSLVAVPGIPETNIQVLESLLRKGPVKVQEQDRPACAVCGQPADFLVSICQGCLDKAGVDTQIQSNEGEKMDKEELKKLVKEALKETGVSEAEWDTEYINNLPDDCFAYIEAGGQKDDQGKTVPRSLRHLPYKNAEGNLDAAHVRNALARLDQTEIPAEAKKVALKKLCAAAGELGIESAVCNLDSTAERLQAELTQTKEKLTQAEGKLTEANSTVEKLKALVPGVDLLKNPPKLMPVSEALERLARVELPKMQERLSLGNQLQAQKVRKEIFEVKQKYGVT